MKNISVILVTAPLLLTPIADHIHDLAVDPLIGDRDVAAIQVSSTAASAPLFDQTVPDAVTGREIEVTHPGPFYRVALPLPEEDE